MLGKTHRAFGFALSTATLAVVHKIGLGETDMPIWTTAVQVALVQGGSVIASTLPDIDQLFATQHRGITHTIWIPVIMCCIAYRMRTNPLIFALIFGLILGYLSHLIGDAFSKAGIAWFYPIQQYTHYSGGAMCVKGFRGPFIPLYTVGDNAFSFMPKVWWIIGILLSVIVWSGLA